MLGKKLVARPWSGAELTQIEASLNALVKHYSAHRDQAKQLIAVGESKADTTIEPPELAAWTMLANELMNLDEVLNK
jgi:hypothetical protein